MSKTCTSHSWITLLLLVVSLAGCGPSSSGSAGRAAKPQSTAAAVTAPAPAPQQVAPAQAQPSTAEKRRVALIIGQVDSAYNNGVAAYKKGKLAEAKSDFDQAVDLMLTSGIDIRSTPELQEEFDRVIDGVNGLETEALKQGNGFVTQEEDTPADVAADINLEVDPTIVAKARAELATTKSDLPLVVNDYVAAYINFFANTNKGHNTLLHSIQRAGRYKAMIQRILAEEGLPQDLIYLAVAESGFQPRAVNRRSGAGGMWQFMPRGPYGLDHTPYVDERFDPEKATRAYARYMKFIYDELGDWYLSMAGYDWGAGNVQHAVQKTGYADYWELYKRNNLPKETKNYVPEIIAAIIIANNPAQYGFDDLTLDPPVLTDTVTINYSIDLHLVSDLVGAPVDELMALNPSLLRMTTPPDSAFDLHLPPGAAAVFNEHVGLVPLAHRNSWRYHRVVSGDTIAGVAREFHLAASEVAAANQMQEGDKIDGAEGILVPISPAPTLTARTMLYTARKGDTLVTISDRFGVSLAQLRHWNKMTGIKVEPGRRLHVAEPQVAQRSPRRRREEAAKGASTTASAASAHRKSASSRTAPSHAASSQTKPASKAARHSPTATKHRSSSAHPSTSMRQK